MLFVGTLPWCLPGSRQEGTEIYMDLSGVLGCCDAVCRDTSLVPGWIKAGGELFSAHTASKLGNSVGKA